MVKKIFGAISEGMVRTLPVILVGSFALVLQSLPISSYQTFLQNFLDGYLYTFFSTIYYASLGIVGIILTLSISYSYAHHARNDMPLSFMASAAALCSYFIIMGMENFSLSQAGGSSIFVAILVAVISSTLFTTICNRQASQLARNYSGMSPALRNSMLCVRPFLGTMVFFTVLKLLMFFFFGDKGIQEILSEGIGLLYTNMGTNLGSCVLYLLSVHCLWMFGVHGENTLYLVSSTLFGPMIEENLAQVAEGMAPTHIFSPTFIDTFINIGGCGASFALIIALFMFGKKKNLKRVARVSLIPGIFNVNEMLVFGIPIVLNPVFVIPFILVPIVNLLLTYLATVIGFLPVITTQVEWSVPVLLSGYLATGTIRGPLFQVFLIAIGVMIYRPFVLHYEKNMSDELKENIGELTKFFQKNEEEGEHPGYIYMTDEIGNIAKMLADELQNAIEEKRLSVFYQPQVDTNEKCFGAEALLRWNYPGVGYIYPPLIIELAKERGILQDLERFVIHTTCDTLKQLNTEFPQNLKLSINLTGTSLKNPDLIEMLEGAIAEHGVLRKNFWLEITEQDAISSAEEIIGRLDKLHELGYNLLIDDFGMGHTSLLYLESSYFNVVKLDGSLTKKYQNERYSEIISSITQLSRNLKFDVIAEYVETEEQRGRLQELGCTGFQGYLYSPAISAESLIDWIRKQDNAESEKE